MGFFDKVGSFLKREAKDLGDAADVVKDKVDQELTKREDELRMTPSEKIAALQQQAAATDAKLDTIADKATAKGSMADAVAEVGELPTGDSLPDITHIVLPDGRVRSGADVGAQTQIVDESGTAHDVPLVEAPTPEDLQDAGDEDVPAEDVADELPEPPDAPASAITGFDESTTANAVEEALDDDEGETPPPPAGPIDDAAGDLPPPPAEATDEPVVDTLGEDQLPAEATPAAISETDEHTTAHAVEEVLDDDADPAPHEVPPADPDPEPATEPATSDLPPPPAATASDAVPAVEVTSPADDQPVADTPTGDQLPAEATPGVISESDKNTTAHAVEEVLDDDADPAPQEVPPVEAAEPSEAAPAHSEAAPAHSEAAEEDDPTKNPSSPDYGKTPAQIKYEQARAAANDLLNELRGELEDDGEI